MPATHTTTPILHTPCRRPTPQANNLPLPTTNYSLTKPTQSHKNLQPPQTHSTTGNPYPQSNTNLLRQPIPTATIKPQSKLKSSTHTHKSTTNAENQTKPREKGNPNHPSPTATTHKPSPKPTPKPTEKTHNQLVSTTKTHRVTTLTVNQWPRERECKGEKESFWERESVRQGRERGKSFWEMRLNKKQIEYLYLMLQYSVSIPSTIAPGILLSNFTRPDGSMFFEIFSYSVIYFC